MCDTGSHSSDPLDGQLDVYSWQRSELRDLTQIKITERLCHHSTFYFKKFWGGEKNPNKVINIKGYLFPLTLSFFCQSCPITIQLLPMVIIIITTTTINKYDYYFYYNVAWNSFKINTAVSQRAHSETIGGAVQSWYSLLWGNSTSQVRENFDSEGNFVSLPVAFN